MDLNDCIKKGLVKKTNVNTNLISSLVEMSKIKQNAVKSAKIDKENISAYVSLAYDSLREVLEALCVLKGYKIISHICIGEFLKKFFPNFKHAEFDRYRWIRNSINYYGEKIEFNQGKELIKKIFNLKKDVLNILK